MWYRNGVSNLFLEPLNITNNVNIKAFYASDLNELMLDSVHHKEMF